jgi:hypothetical protein
LADRIFDKDIRTALFFYRLAAKKGAFSAYQQLDFQLLRMAELATLDDNGNAGGHWLNSLAEVKSYSAAIQSRKMRLLGENDFPLNLHARLNLALEWLERAEAAEQAGDIHGRFIFLWIAFNAAYARDIDERQELSEQAAFIDFLEQLCAIDDGRLDDLVWREFSGGIRVLLDTPRVFQAFWDWNAGRISQSEWESRFAKGKQLGQQALARGKTPELLGLVFSRLYTLRNNLVHGYAGVNRTQLRDCGNLMGKFVPLMLELMLDHLEVDWGPACYLVREQEA